MTENLSAEQKLAELQKELDEARKQINRLKVSVRAEELRVKISSEYTNFGLWEYDIAEKICYQYKKLNGRYEDKLDPIVNFRETVISWGSVYADDLTVFCEFCDAMDRGEKEVGCDVRCINDDCDLVWFRYEGKTIFDDDGKPMRVIGRTLDVTAEKGGISEKTDSRRDPLTGAYTNDAFQSIVIERTTGMNRYKSAALLLISIDGYSSIVQRSGEDFSALAQQTVAKVLSGMSACEHDSCFARTNDGEFAFYLRFNDVPSLNSFASKVVYTINQYDFSSHVRLTVSVGISLFKNGKKLRQVRNEAEIALRVARAKGGDGYLLYSNAMAADIVECRTDISESDIGARCTVSNGSVQIYNLIAKAFIDKSNRSANIKKALIVLAKAMNASTLCLYWYKDGGFVRYVTYNGSGLPDESAPCVAYSISDEKLHRLFSENHSITLDGNRRNEEDTGLFLANGAVDAECFSITHEEKTSGFFAVAADHGFAYRTDYWELLELISGALGKMFSAFADDNDEKKQMHFANTIINNLQLEGFSIIPDTFEVDYVGNNALAHYGLKKGDICYKVIRGQDAPCKDCPAHQLSRGQLLASGSFYNDRERRWQVISASAEDNERGELRYNISSTDITNCLGQIKTYDLLTGVMTFDAFTAEAMRITAGDPTGYFVSVINIAGFRRLNEENGYEYGNSLLIAVADTLERAIGSDELLCRSEGSRFIMLFRNKSFNDLLIRLNQLLTGIQKQVYERTKTQIYLIVGVYDMDDEPVGIMGALDRAITAQKTIKDKTYYQENLIAAYDMKLKSELKNRRYVEAHMIEALDNDEFKVYYQPKVSISTGKVVGAEALVRWIRPDGEIISPGMFVPIFEANGFISDMDFAIYRHAIADIKRWIRNGIKVPLISLNVSRHHLRDENFSAKLNALVDGLGVPHDMIELEITESMLSENLNKLVEIMTQLKSSGFRISVDDFGSGYSSLNLITLLPFDTLKIDGGFFLRNKLTEKNKTVISTVVTLAKSLNLETVSEGVETQEQVEFLRKLGCDTIQGYYYYKPMSGAEFEKLISEQ